MKLFTFQQHFPVTVNFLSPSSSGVGAFTPSFTVHDKYVTKFLPLKSSAAVKMSSSVSYSHLGLLATLPPFDRWWYCSVLCVSDSYRRKFGQIYTRI